MADPQAWASIGSEWVDLGYVHDDGLVIIDDLPQAEPFTPWRGGVWIVDRDRRTGRTRAYGDDGTPRSRRRLAKAIARFDRTERAIRWPRSGRVKRAYHRRRR